MRYLLLALFGLGCAEEFSCPRFNIYLGTTISSCESLEEGDRMWSADYQHGDPDEGYECTIPDPGGEVLCRRICYGALLYAEEGG